MPLAYEVSGAGTAAVNGDYSAEGTYLGGTYYQIAGGGFLMWRSGAPGSPGNWSISVNLGDPTAFMYYRTANQVNPDDGPWARLTQGTNPPPTVTEIKRFAARP